MSELKDLIARADQILASFPANLPNGELIKTNIKTMRDGAVLADEQIGLGYRAMDEQFRTDCQAMARKLKIYEDLIRVFQLDD